MPNMPPVSRRMVLVNSAALMAISSLSACGFRPRGSADIPFATLFLGVSEGSGLGNELRRNLRSSAKVQLVNDVKAAEARLDILSEAREKEVLSVNRDGRAREYTLRYRLNFRVHDGKGREFIPATDITLKRDITFNEDARLAKESEEALLYRDMQTDMVQQLLRRLAAIQK
jgi:LPS-assembly lipoprotein